MKAITCLQRTTVNGHLAHPSLSLPPSSHSLTLSILHSVLFYCPNLSCVLLFLSTHSSLSISPSYLTPLPLPSSLLLREGCCSNTAFESLSSLEAASVHLHQLLVCILEEQEVCVHVWEGGGGGETAPPVVCSASTQPKETGKELTAKEERRRVWLCPSCCTSMLNSVWYAKKMGRRIMGTLRRTKKLHLRLLVGSPPFHRGEEVQDGAAT